MIRELYKFQENVTIWTVTSSDKKVNFDGFNYLPTAIGRNNIESVQELNKSNIEIRTSVDNVMAKRWLQEIIENIVSVIIYEDDGINTDVIFRGRLASVKPEGVEIILTFEPIFTKSRRYGFKKRYQRTCPYVLYHGKCKLNRENFKVPATLTANLGNNGYTITEAGLFISDWFTTGMLADTAGNFRYIVDHIGTQIVLMRALVTLIPPFPISVFLYPGCDRTIQTCDTKFQNKLNHGGFAYVPLKNPFTLTSII